MPRHHLTNPAKYLAEHHKGSIRCLSHFRLVEHTARCQHTRDRPAAAELSKDHALQLAVKQYIPKNNSRPGPNDVTLIGAHANAFPKEIYEPFWDDVYECLEKQGRKIRSVWIADQYNQGQSGVVNEKLLGNDPGWWDHGRDLLSLINQFQDDISHPIIGIGHSMGGLHLAHLSLMHPRLLDALVLIDPVIQIPNPSRVYALASTYRRDLWPSRADAAASFANSKFYQKWDPRVLQSWIDYGLRELPTEQYTDEQTSNGAVPVTLTTTKAQEVYNFLRPAYHEERMLEAPSQRDEMHPEDIDDFLMYRPEPPIIFRDLERLRPSTMYIFGETSELSTVSLRKAKMDMTGVGLGGSGGKGKGQVEEVALDCGHLVPMEKPKECAATVAVFVDKKLQEFEVLSRRRQAVWSRLTRKDRVGINDQWREHIGPPPQRARKSSDKLQQNGKSRDVAISNPS